MIGQMIGHFRATVSTSLSAINICIKSYSSHRPSLLIQQAHLRDYKALLLNQERLRRHKTRIRIRVGVAFQCFDLSRATFHRVIGLPANKRCLRKQTSALHDLKAPEKSRLKRYANNTERQKVYTITLQYLTPPLFV